MYTKYDCPGLIKLKYTYPNEPLTKKIPLELNDNIDLLLETKI